MSESRIIPTVERAALLERWRADAAYWRQAPHEPTWQEYQFRRRRREHAEARVAELTVQAQTEAREGWERGG